MAFYKIVCGLHDINIDSQLILKKYHKLHNDILSSTKLMTDILNISGFIVKEYLFIEEVGFVLYLENFTPTAACLQCGAITVKLHQNYLLILRDIRLLARIIL